MLAGLFGIAGLVLALFAVGGFMEGDMGKVGKYGAGFVICGVLALMAGAGTERNSTGQHCSTDWDGRANSEVCD
jgi:hypothetical protein